AYGGDEGFGVGYREVELRRGYDVIVDPGGEDEETWLRRRRNRGEQRDCVGHGVGALGLVIDAQLDDVDAGIELHGALALFGGVAGDQVQPGGEVLGREAAGVASVDEKVARADAAAAIGDAIAQTQHVGAGRYQRIDERRLGLG